MTKLIRNRNEQKMEIQQILYKFLPNSKSATPSRESNPDLARDRRGYSPLYYRRLTAFGLQSFTVKGQ